MSVRTIVAVVSAIAALLGAVATSYKAWNEPQQAKEGGAKGTTSTSGSDSPAVSNVQGPVHIEYNYVKQDKIPSLEILDIRLPANNTPQLNAADSLGELKDSEIISLIDKLNSLSGSIVYIRFWTYVGAGFGLDDVPKNQAMRAGVIYDLNFARLDGFGGNRGDYSYGYVVSLREYRDEWRRSKEATILFPANGNAFFDVHYMKSMTFEGMAKIKVSSMQGSQFIEIIPAIPTDTYRLAYDAAKAKLPKDR